MRQEDFNWCVLQIIFAALVVFLGRIYFKSQHYKNGGSLAEQLLALFRSALRLSRAGDDHLNGNFGPGRGGGGRGRGGRGGRGGGAAAKRGAGGRGPVASSGKAAPHRTAPAADVDDRAAQSVPLSDAALEQLAATRLNFLEDLSASSDGSDSASVTSEPVVASPKPASPTSAKVGDEPSSPVTADGYQVRVVHDLRAGQDFGENAKAAQAIAELSKETLLGISVFDIISKKNRMKVTGYVRVDGEGNSEALGFVVHRLNQHTLQVLYLGVASGHRRSGVGRMLVRAARETARREQMCLSIIVLLESSTPDVASVLAVSAGGDDTPLAGVMAFWRAVGFRRSDVKGLDEDQICFKIKVRELGKKQKRQLDEKGQQGGGTTLDWEEVLGDALLQAKRSSAANRGTEAGEGHKKPGAGANGCASAGGRARGPASASAATPVAVSLGLPAPAPGARKAARQAVEEAVVEEAEADEDEEWEEWEEEVLDGRASSDHPEKVGRAQDTSIGGSSLNEEAAWNQVENAHGSARSSQHSGLTATVTSNNSHFQHNSADWHGDAEIATQVEAPVERSAGRNQQRKAAKAKMAGIAAAQTAAMHVPAEPHNPLDQAPTSVAVPAAQTSIVSVAAEPAKPAARAPTSVADPAQNDKWMEAGDAFEGDVDASGDVAAEAELLVDVSYVAPMPATTTYKPRLAARSANAWTPTLRHMR